MTARHERAGPVDRLLATTGERRRLAGACFVALAAVFLTVSMLAAAVAPAYDFGSAAISDLGVIPETALAFNAALVAAGVLNAVGGYAFYREHGKRWLFATYALAGLGAVGAGVFPLDTGGLHSLSALFAFVFFNAEALGTATLFDGVLRWLGALAGVVGLAFVVVMVVGDAGNAAAFGPIGHGGAERMIVYPSMLWLLVLGGALLGRAEN